MTRKKISNKLLTAAAVLLAILSLAAWLPKAMGLESYYVQTGSMAPAIPKGSMAYIEPIDEIGDIQAGVDVLLFSNEAQTKAFMHRAMYVDEETQAVYTKGDANTTADLLPTSFSMCRGRVLFSVPYWGYVALALNSVWGKAAIALVYIIWLAVEIEALRARKKVVKS